jgi:hypothetical protein
MDVSLTDYGLAAECAFFAYIFARKPKSAFSLSSVFTLFFCGIVLAAAAGGTVHGFFLNESSLGYRILWPFTLVVMGITALAGVHIGTALQFTRSVATYINRAAIAVFAAYVLVVIFIRSDFLVAILDYFPSLIFIGVAFLLAHRRHRKSELRIGFLGVCTMLLAAAAQQAKIGINPRFFDHNALYHVLQAVALFMVFLAARESAQPQELVN